MESISLAGRGGVILHNIKWRFNKLDIEKGSCALGITDGLPDPKTFIAAVKEFAKLLEIAHKEVGGKGKLKWGVQVYEGSNMVGFKPQDDIGLYREVSDLVVRGMQDPEVSNRHPGLATCYTSLKDVFQKGDLGAYIISEAGKSYLNESHVLSSVAPAKRFKESGSVEGILTKLDSSDKFSGAQEPNLEFAVYDTFSQRRIVCQTKDQEIFDFAQSHYEKPVSVTGLVSYDDSGHPDRVQVEKLDLIARDANFDYKTTLGILEGVSFIDPYE